MSRPPGTYAILETSQGSIVCFKLFDKEAPNTVANFVGLAEGTKEFTDPRSGGKTKRPFFDGLAFHRVIPNFMSSGWLPVGQRHRRTGLPFRPTNSIPRCATTRPANFPLANAGPGTNGSQFFVTVAATPWLTTIATRFSAK